MSSKITKSKKEAMRHNVTLPYSIAEYREKLSLSEVERR
jgi:hypothetical protein